MTKYFVAKGSIVRTIWGKADTVLFIFAGAAAEFALNKAVDWLYFTGRLPADPLGRLFSTVTYARQIIFSEENDALHAIDKITAIHQGVENNRGSKIPAWAYRAVLFLLIDYSIRSFELLERKLTEHESIEIFEVFNRVGLRMGLKGLPLSFTEWKQMRNSHLLDDFIRSDFTTDLYRQYQSHLGKIRFKILMQVQAFLVPQTVGEMLALKKKLWFSPVLPAYKLSRLVKLDGLLKSLLLPAAYKSQINKLDITDNP
jgi:hypothetical protein